MMHVSIDRRGLEQLENNLDRLGEYALPRAVQQTVNDAAFDVRKRAVAFARHTFTMRNAYTVRSIQVDKALPHRNIKKIESSTGSTLDYMAEQEEGFTKHTQGQHGIAVPTPGASGQDGANKRTRAIRARNLLSRIKIARGVAAEFEAKYPGRRQRIVRLVQHSLKHGYRVIFWTSQNRREQGIYRIIGGSRSTKRGWPAGATLKLLYQVADRSQTTEPHPWLEPSTYSVVGTGDYLRRHYIHHMTAMIERYSRRR